MMRRLPPFVVHWLRNAPELTAAVGIPKLRVFVALNMSARNCARTFSPMRVFLMIPKSRLPIPSARRMLRPAVPKRSQVVAGCGERPVALQGTEELLTLDRGAG